MSNYDLSDADVLAELQKLSICLLPFWGAFSLADHVLKVHT